MAVRQHKFAGHASSSGSTQWPTSRQLPKHIRKNNIKTYSIAEIGNAASTAVEVATTTRDLILNTYSYDALNHGLPGSIDGHYVKDFLHTLNHALQGSDMSSGLAHHSSIGVSDHISNLQNPGILEQVNIVSDYSLPTTLSSAADIAASADIGQLGTVISNPEFTSAASAASAYVDSSNSFQSLAVWATNKLAVAQSIDPDAFNIMKGGLTSLIASVQEVLDAQAAEEAQNMTNTLVMGVQQLVMAARLPTGTASIDAIMAAQQAMTSAGSVSTDNIMKITLGVIALIIASIPREDSSVFGMGPGPGNNSTWGELTHHLEGVPIKYDQQELAAFFSNHPVLVLQRSAQVVSQISGFTASILMDWRLGKWESSMPARAIEARIIIEGLGPAFIKIAQALSTRVDIFPAAYIDEFQVLQDNVPTFPTMAARIVLERGLGRNVDEVFDWLSEEPIAAASLGQVYRGKLRDNFGGTEVAVKVQRPGVLASVALDVFLMSRAATIFSKLPGMSDQWSNVMDDWAMRFFQEMDYSQEMRNTMLFKEHMSTLQGVKVATVYPELTSRCVIVTEWIEGERLAESASTDVRALCVTLINAYLVQLLETGLLHADPHPGNLMRTRDGKIVILDFGLMTEVSEEQRIGLVEFIAHLTVEDWVGVSRDLVTLGFVPPDTLPEGAFLQIAPVMREVMGVLVRGGGLGKSGLSIMSLTQQLEGVSRDYQLCIPPYFALVLRAFSTIEGIALKADPSYAIVSECLPYLSRRLLTDNNPRMKAALRQLLYGNKARLDVARLMRLVVAFSAFSTAAAPSIPSSSALIDEDGSLTSVEEPPLINDAMREALKVVFSEDGSYAQELVVDELVAAVDALSREALGETLKMVGSSAGAFAALRAGDALGPLKLMMMPLPPVPGEVLHAVELSADDHAALDTVRAVVDLVRPMVAGGRVEGRRVDLQSSSRLALKAASELVPLVPELMPGVRSTIGLFARQLTRRMAQRLADDLSTPTRLSSSSSASRNNRS